MLCTSNESSCFTAQLSNVSPFSVKRRFRDLRPHPLREMSETKKQFFSMKNVDYLQALAQRISDVSDLVENSFVQNEIVEDMHTAYTLYDGSRALTGIKAGGRTVSSMMKDQNTNVSSKVAELNKLAEIQIRIRIRSALRHAEMLRRLGVGRSAQAGRVGRPHGMVQRPVIQQNSRRDASPFASALGVAV